MPTTRGSFPHPVLDVSDDVAGTFDLFNVNITRYVEDVEVSFQIRLTDPQIRARLDDGSAKYNFRWKCSSTIESGALNSDNLVPMADGLRFTAWIDQRRIRRTVRVDVSVVAATEIPDYRLDAQHPDYGSATFHLFPGDTIADAGYFEFECEKLFDPLNPPLGSCFKFVADRGLTKGLTVNFHEDECVVVGFPPDRLADFGTLGPRPDLQISLVVLPALMETISFIKSNDEAGDAAEDLSDRRWLDSIRELVSKVGTMSESPMKLAQRILENPIDRTLSLSLAPTEDDE